MADRGGHREHALSDADGDTFESPGPVLFEIELALERVVDRLDQPAYRFEHRPAVALGLVLARGAQQGDVVLLAQRAPERTPGEAFVCVHQDAWVLDHDIVGLLAANKVLRPQRCASITHVPEKLTLINPPGLHPTAGYAHVTIAEAGRTAHLAGLCPLDENEAVVGLGRLEAQIDQVIANGLRILTAVGARPHDVVRSVIYVVSDESRTLGAAWAQLTASELAPALATASTLLGVTCLGYSGQLIEIDLTVAL